MAWPTFAISISHALVSDSSFASPSLHPSPKNVSRGAANSVQLHELSHTQYSCTSCLIRTERVGRSNVWAAAAPGSAGRYKQSIVCFVWAGDKPRPPPALRRADVDTTNACSLCSYCRFLDGTCDALSMTHCCWMARTMCFPQQARLTLLLTRQALCHPLLDRSNDHFFAQGQFMYCIDVATTPLLTLSASSSPSPQIKT